MFQLLTGSLSTTARVAYRGAPVLAVPALMSAVFSTSPGGQRQLSLEFAADREAASAGIAQTEFPLFGTDDVVARLTSPPQPGVEILTLSVFFASTVRHLTLRRAFHSIGPGVDAVPDPDTGLSLPVVEAPVENGRATRIIPIPVLGTALERFGLSGEYEVRVETDGPSPLEAQGRFTLTASQGGR